MMISAEAQEVIDKHNKWKLLNSYENRRRNPIATMWNRFNESLYENRYVNEWYDKNYSWLHADSIASEGYIDPRSLSIDHPLV